MVDDEQTSGQGGIVDYSIVDKEVAVEAGCHIGFGEDLRPNRKEPDLLKSGITIVGKKARIPLGMKIGRNCVIGCDVRDDDFPASEIQSGETVMPKRSRSSRQTREL